MQAVQAPTACAGSKIIGVGRSYRHNWPDLQSPGRLPEPLIFLKPYSSLSTSGEAIKVPDGCVIDEEALALDLAAKNLLTQAKQNGTPWSVAKGFDTFTSVGRFIPIKELGDPQNVELSLEVNGKVQQHGNTNELIYTIPQLVAFASTLFTLEAGDIILTGTTAGQGPIAVGDTVTATMRRADGHVLDKLTFEVQRSQGRYSASRYWLDGLQ